MEVNGLLALGVTPRSVDSGFTSTFTSNHESTGNFADNPLLTDARAGGRNTISANVQGVATQIPPPPARWRSARCHDCPALRALRALPAPRPRDEPPSILLLGGGLMRLPHMGPPAPPANVRTVLARAVNPKAPKA